MNGGAGAIIVNDHGTAVRYLGRCQTAVGEVKEVIEPSQPNQLSIKVSFVVGLPLGGVDPPPPEETNKIMLKCCQLYECTYYFKGKDLSETGKQKP